MDTKRKNSVQQPVCRGRCASMEFGLPILKKVIKNGIKIEFNINILKNNKTRNN
jgi:hypothetical protein